MEKKIIGLIVTSGERNLEKTLNSILFQTRKIDKIFIASEIKIESEYSVLINPYKKGLARNTNQALIKIRELYHGENIFIATIDDDDFWKKNYIEEVERMIDKGYNFIAGWLEVFDNNIKIDEYCFLKKDINIETFLKGNIGILGSNKVFDLDLALESGAMAKHINSSTDRVFNISLLLHPETNVGVIDKIVVRYQKCSSRKRISNNLDRIESLQSFYKHYDAYIKKEDVLKINERHEMLHKIYKVITWK